MNNNEKKDLLAKSSIFYISEFFGTFLLAISIGSYTYEDIEGNQFMDLQKFLLTLTLILSICNILGTADLNPAVSYLKYQIMPDKFKKYALWCMLFNYTFIQYIAAISGFFISFQMNGNHSVQMRINPQISQSNGLLMEIYASCVLYMVIAVLEHTYKMYNELALKVFATVIGVGTGIAMGSKTSGAGMNPAITFGANFVRFLHTGKIEEFKDIWLYTLGPYIASYLIGNFYNKIYMNETYYKKGKIKKGP
jgi:glycerol uptake facilitator-like aquaporin